MKLNAKTFRVSSAYWPRREFDPANSVDLAEYRGFLETSSWKNGCPFVVEWPFLNVIDRIESKIVRQHIGSLITKSKVK